MITTDSLLIELFQQGIERLEITIPTRDKKILISLSKQIISGHFLTENQAKLLGKILKENSKHLPQLTEEHRAVVEFPTWSQPFRVIEQLRKIFIVKDNDSRIIVEFTYNKRLRQVIADLNKSIEGQMLSINGKQYSIPLTEQNVHTVVNTFKSQGFDIDPILMRFYEEILEILLGTADQFEIFKITNDKMLSLIKKDVTDIDENNLKLLNDRSHRFQYSIYPKNSEISLSNSLANRPGTKVWIDSNTTPITDIIQALQTLNRLPVLLVFNGHDSKESLQNLKKLAGALENNNIKTSAGIYFRFDNVTDNNKEFNQLISHLGYNTPLDDTILVAGIANNKLPKFMLKNGWYPSSVISFSNNFKSNKTSVYCDAVDLIVYYNDKRPLGGVDAIV
jgi:hypothetical protein